MSYLEEPDDDFWGEPGIEEECETEEEDDGERHSNDD